MNANISPKSSDIWRKSSHSNQDACIEIHHTLHAIRDSKDATSKTVVASDHLDITQLIKWAQQS